MERNGNGIERLTDCECGQPEEGRKTFLCARHNVRKTAHYQKLCSTDSGYFKAWEEGHGPGQFGKPPDTPTPAESPCLANKTWKYAVALAKWVKAGRPVRSEAEIQRIFVEVCQPCGSFEPRNTECRVCGCGEKLPGIVKVVAATLEAALGRLNGMQYRLLRKIAMATEECPKGKEKWLTPEPAECHYRKTKENS